jgi:hypothetical protein
MKPYRFSPIHDEETLLKAIQHTHELCFDLCKEAMGDYLPVAGNIGIFCHYEEEFDYLTKLRKSLTHDTGVANQKYYPLIKPIIIRDTDSIPGTIYTHLYIRKPDPYRHHVGDVDFYLPDLKYQELKQSLLDGKKIDVARIFPRSDLDMIELHHPDYDVLGYISTELECKIAHTHKTLKV